MPKIPSFPYFPYYPADMESSSTVIGMTTKAFGAYQHLINIAWHQTPPCSLPNNDVLLAQWSRLKLSEWKRIKSSVLIAFVLRKDNRYYQCRLEHEYKKLKNSYKKAVKNGKKGANALWRKIKQDK